MATKIAIRAGAVALAAELNDSPTASAVAEAWRAWGEKTMYGKKRMGIIRSSFLVDEKGKLSHVWYNVKPDDTVPKAQQALAGEA